ncbi:hypothetical protein [Thiofaba sp. EF100]|uniref:hypothetical protein n=1 Tax=Thiofaba sp. EF100 TaxID=3121274 RepID=UPI003221F98B
MSGARRFHGIVVGVLVALMLLEFFVAVWEGQWMTTFLIAAILAIALAPMLAPRRMPVAIPAEFHLLAVLFIFASLFLGEVHRFYERVWWWDMVLHASSGLLLGILGFLLVYVLNENERVDLHLRPGFVALFAFLFALGAGVLWEIFEFGMDRLFGMNMQKPMFGDPSGLTDTMWDLILDALGALVISLLGWWYMKHRQVSFIEAWIRKFIASNPRLFRS